jgi:hypothetical protein
MFFDWESFSNGSLVCFRESLSRKEKMDLKVIPEDPLLSFNESSTTR